MRAYELVVAAVQKNESHHHLKIIDIFEFSA